VRWLRIRIVAVCAWGSGALLLLLVAAWWRDYSRYGLGSSSRIGRFVLGTDQPWSVIDIATNFSLLVLALLSVRAGWSYTTYWWRNRTRPKKEPPRSVVVSDAPVACLSDDALSRSTFVETISTVLLSGATDFSTVVGIEGRWGEGKTSVLRMVAAALDACTPSPVVIWFDPWPEDSKRGVVARLLDDIAYRIARCPDISPLQRRSATRGILAIADAVGRDLGATYSIALRNLTRWLFPTVVGSAREPVHSLSADRDLVANVLRGLPTRLIVIVDDLDRVDAEELRSILMAINALSRFPNTSFLVAFDPSVVDTQLESLRLTSPDIPFREKIVNVTLPLPTAAFADRLRFFQTAFTMTLEARGLSAGWAEWDEELRRQAEILAVRVITSPRSLKRLANHASVVLERVGQEVNGPDVLILELLRIQFPVVWAFVRDHRNNFDPLDAYDEGQLPDDRDPRVRVPSSDREDDSRTPGLLLDISVADVPNGMRQQVLRLMGILFPLTRRKFTRDDREELQRHARVALGQNLRQYFSLGVSGAAISIRDVRALLYETQSREALLASYGESGLLAALASTSAVHVEPARETPELDKLLILLLRSVKTAWCTHRENACDEVADFILKLLGTVKPKARVAALSRVMESEESVCASHDVLLALLRSAKLWENGVLYPDRIASATAQSESFVGSPELLELKDLWVKTAWSYGFERLFRQEPEPLSVLYRLAQLEGPKGNDYQKVRAATESFIATTPNLRLLVEQYSSRLTGRPVGVDGLEKLLPDWSRFMERVRALQEPEDAIAKLAEYTPPTSSA